MVYITLFGSLSVSHDESVLIEESLNTKKITTLLSYLIYNRNKLLTLDNIYAVLWPNENSDNPAHALRNLIYRARKLLNNAFGGDEDYILTLESNSYCWNKNIETVVDIELFEEYIKQANTGDADIFTRINCYLKAVELYKDDFMTSLSYQDWVVPITTYYRYVYTSAVDKLTELLFSLGRYDEALNVLVKATHIDQFNETLHRRLMDTYYKQGQLEKAAKHYQFITQLFYKDLGVRLSDETKKLYKQISASDSIIDADIDNIVVKLKDKDDLTQPLFCSFDAFMNLYSLQVRNLQRKNESQYLILLTISSKNGTTPPSELIAAERLKLEGILKKTLRKNDVVAGYSFAQYLIMLSTLSYENAIMVKNRILAAATNINKEVMYTFSIIPIMSISEKSS